MGNFHFSKLIFFSFFCVRRMRDIKITYNHIKNIRARAETIIKDLDKREILDPKIEEEICSAKSLDALDHLVYELVFSQFFACVYPSFL